MKIYLDVFFTVNFLMNLLVFEIMNIFLRKRPVSIRCAAASAEGALAAVLLVPGGWRGTADGSGIHSYVSHCELSDDTDRLWKNNGLWLWQVYGRVLPDSGRRCRRRPALKRERGNPKPSDPLSPVICNLTFISCTENRFF